MLFKYFNIICLFSTVIFIKSEDVKKTKQDEKKNKKYSFSLYISAVVVDLINNYDCIFDFSKYNFDKNCEFYKRINIGIDNLFNINRILDYYFSFDVGLGSFYSENKRAALVFCDIIPLGMFFRISEKVFVGYQVGFDVMINPKNIIKDFFYLSYKNIFFKVNFIRFKSDFLFTFSKEIKVFDFVDKHLLHFFLNGWELKFSTS